MKTKEDNKEQQIDQIIKRYGVDAILEELKRRIRESPEFAVKVRAKIAEIEKEEQEMKRKRNDEENSKNS